MGTEKISGKDLQNPKADSLRHEDAVREEQEQIKELLRRGSIRHYFLGPENIWSREGFGTVVGGALAILFGSFIFPRLFLHSSNSAALMIVCQLMAGAGAVIALKGLYGMYRESKKESKPVPDSVYDEILEHDLAGLEKTSKATLKERIPVLKAGDSFDGMGLLLVKGPRDYVANVNLPLVWRRGEDGRLRYSNFSLMALYFGKETLYIATCIFNMRNGTAKFHHAYECPYGEIRFAGFQDIAVETVNQNNKAVTQNLKMLVIDAGDGEDGKLSMPVADYDVMKRLNGTMDLRDAEEAVKILSGKVGEAKDQ